MVNRLLRVGVVILNWNRPFETLACLDSLRRSNVGSDCLSFEIVVVDNGSVDGSPELLRRLRPDVTVIENGHNLGFAAGSNVGIRHLLNRGVDFVFLLNDDAEVAPDSIRILVDEAISDSGVGIVGPKIYYHDPGNVIWFAGGCVDRYGRASHPGVDRRDDSAADVSRDVDYVTGCAMLVKRDVIERIGLLDERFFAYFEETEWCARARSAGFRVIYVPRARVWHKIKPNDRPRSPLYLYLMARNRLLYLRCVHASPSEIALASLDLVRTAISWLLRPRHQDMRRYSSVLLRGVWDFLLGRFGAPPVSMRGPTG